MTDKEIFETYCEIIDIPLECIENESDKLIITNTLGYEKYKLKCSVDDLKKAIKNQFKMFLTIIKNHFQHCMARDQDDGYRLVLFGSVPVIIIMAIYFLMEYFG